MEHGREMDLSVMIYKNNGAWERNGFLSVMIYKNNGAWERNGFKCNDIQKQWSMGEIILHSRFCGWYMWPEIIWWPRSVTEMPEFTPPSWV